MTSVEAIDRVRAAQPLTMRAIVDTWRSLTAVQIRATVAFGVAISLFHVIVWSYGMLQRPSLARPLIATFLADQLAAFTLMLGVVVADRTTGTEFGRRTAYTVAIIVSAILMAPLGSIAALNIVQPDFGRSDFLNSVVYAFFEWLVLGGAATFIYTDRRRARAAIARMHAAEIERARAAKRTLESRLQAMQARVEPQFLFNTLAQVRDLYRASAERGERMLDELIAYLRAAMPKMRDTSSTLGQELELARAYLAIVKVRLGECYSYRIESPIEDDDARVPPMMLLPLVDRMIAHSPSAPGTMIAIEVQAKIFDDRVRLEMVARGANPELRDDDSVIAGIRDRLSALYGSDASLVVRPRAVGVVLEIPYLPVESIGAASS